MKIGSFIVRRFDPDLFWFMYKLGNGGGIFLIYLKSFI